MVDGEQRLTQVIGDRHGGVERRVLDDEADATELLRVFGEADNFTHRDRQGALGERGTPSAVFVRPPLVLAIRAEHVRGNGDRRRGDCDEGRVDDDVGKVMTRLVVERSPAGDQLQGAVTV